MKEDDLMWIEFEFSCFVALEMHLVSKNYSNFIAFYGILDFTQLDLHELGIEDRFLCEYLPHEAPSTQLDRCKRDPTHVSLLHHHKLASSNF